MITAYLAGPDVFLPDAAAHAARKIALCAQYGIKARAPLDDSPAHHAPIPPWRTIYAANIAMMETCDIVIANLTPFRGASADAGTLLEIGWFLGRNRPIHGYSNTATTFATRSRTQIHAAPDRMAGLALEDFALPDNLMIPGAIESTGGTLTLPPGDLDLPFNSLQAFEACLAAIRAPTVRAGR